MLEHLKYGNCDQEKDLLLNVVEVQFEHSYNSYNISMLLNIDRIPTSSLKSNHFQNTYLG